MEIDKQKLIAILEAMIDTAHVFERELMLYQLIFKGFCQQQGLDEHGAQTVLDRARAASADRIKEATEKGYRDLVAKIPQLVDLLDSNRDEFLKILSEWKPQGPPN